jgi:hypothetical protein
MKQVLTAMLPSVLVMTVALHLGAEKKPTISPKVTAPAAIQTMPAIAGKASGQPMASILGANAVKAEPARPSVALKNQALSEALKLVPPGLGTPVELTARAPYSEWARVSSFFADSNPHFGHFGLNGRGEQERLTVTFKPQAANKPVLVTIGVAQAAGGTETPSLNIRGSGVTATQQLTTTPTNVNVVITPADTNWYKLELRSTGLALISRIELTPTL